MITVGRLKAITKGKLIQGSASAEIKAVSIDSRTTKKRSCFIAIKGHRLDGHQYIRTAIRKGAAAVIVSQSISCSDDIAVIRVKDTTAALGQIAAWHRSRHNIPVIAVTGSAGKTTTKELITSVLSACYKVLKNTKTENNQFGVPLTLLRLNERHQIAVLELGTNRKGEIASLAKIVRPTAVVLTNIGESHLAGLKSPQGVFQEKIQILKYLKPGGTVFLNGDDPYLRAVLKRKTGKRAVTFGCNDECRFKADHMAIRNNRCLEFKVRNRLFTVQSPATHNIVNALAAISCGLHYKIRYNEMKRSIARFRFCDGRQEIIRQGRYWFIDDTYNANPISLNSAVRTLNTLSVRGKRIVVCADMLELGPRSVGLHRSAGKMIARSDTDVVLTLGPHARYITECVHRFNDRIEARHCRNINEVHRRLKGLAGPGDAVLVKGSRGMHMERTVAFLKTHFK